METGQYRMSRWWGWGEEGKEYPLPDEHPLWNLMADYFGLSKWEVTPHPAMDSIEVPDPRITDSLLDGCKSLIGESTVGTDGRDRLIHGSGKSYRDLVRLRTSSLPLLPDMVLYPETEREVLDILAYAAESNLGIVPFGGGSSVVGGVEHMGGSLPGVKGRATVDLAAMGSVLDLDEHSLLARVQPGIRGPELEAALNREGFSLGHFPQSFEFSTLGGWIASRSAGQNSTLYGKIEDMVAGLRMATPSGMISLPPCPASATGPSMREVLVGSEGILGIITEATVKIHRMTEEEDYRGFYFIDFSSGVEAIRELMQRGLKPSVIRLSDPPESALSFKLASGHGGIFSSIVSRLGKGMIDLMGFDREKGCFMICGFDGSGEENRVAWDRTLDIFHRRKVFSLGRSAGRKWKKERFELPYLRDRLIDRSVMVDTLETATTWRNLFPLYDAVTRAMDDSIRATGVKGVVMAHISHVYPDGGSLYFTFMAPMVRGREIDQWVAVKKAASEAIVAGGGTISHHHGVGFEHAPWWKKQFGPTGYALLKGMKESLDPKRIMNPGKFGL